MYEWCCFIQHLYSLLMTLAGIKSWVFGCKMRDSCTCRKKGWNKKLYYLFKGIFWGGGQIHTLVVGSSQFWDRRDQVSQSLSLVICGVAGYKQQDTNSISKVLPGTCPAQKAIWKSDLRLVFLFCITGLSLFPNLFEVFLFQFLLPILFVNWAGDGSVPNTANEDPVMLCAWSQQHKERLEVSHIAVKCQRC